MRGFVWSLRVPEAAENIDEASRRPKEAARQVLRPPELKRARTKRNEMGDLEESYMRT